jgi:hypothetical protein
MYATMHDVTPHEQAVCFVIQQPTKDFAIFKILFPDWNTLECRHTSSPYI